MNEYIILHTHHNSSIILKTSEIIEFWKNGETGSRITHYSKSVYTGDTHTISVDVKEPPPEIERLILGEPK